MGVTRNRFSTGSDFYDLNRFSGSILIAIEIDFQKKLETSTANRRGGKFG